jgi:uncharacterized membrane protein
VWPGVVSLWVVTAAVLVFADVESPLRTAIVLPFLFVCPGMALVRLLRLREQLIELMLAIALSLALALLMSAAYLYAGAWNVKAIFATLITITAVASLIDIFAMHSKHGESRK